MAATNLTWSIHSMAMRLTNMWRTPPQVANDMTLIFFIFLSLKKK